MKKVSKEQLNDMYWNKQMTQRQIGKAIHCCEDTVHKLLKQHKIKFRKRWPKIYCCKDCGGKISRQTALQGLGKCKKCFKIHQKIHCKWNIKYKQIIYDLYYLKNYNQYRIAEALNTKQSIISELIKRFGISKPTKPNKEYKCKDCNKNISPSSLRCRSCCNKYNHKVGILNSKGKNNPAYKHGRPKCVDCEKQLQGYGHKRCKPCRNKFHAMKGRRNPAFGKTYWSYISYNNTKFKSSWEANFAKWCDLSGIKWDYETTAFYLIVDNKETTYTPDFYLPEFDCWIEVKGWWMDKALKKFQQFKQDYDKITIKVFNEEKLKQMGVI